MEEREQEPGEALSTLMLTWSARAAATAAALALLELVLVVVVLPLSASSVSGAGSVWLLCAGVYFCFGLPLALLAALLEHRVPRLQTTAQADMAKLLALCLGALLAVALTQVSTAWIDAQPWEFPDAMANVRALLSLGALILALALAFYALIPALRALGRRAPSLLAPRWVIAALSAAASLASMVFVHGVLAPVYVVRPAGALGVVALGLGLVSARCLAHSIERRPAWVLFGSAVLGLAFTLFTPQVHGRFVLFNHASAAGPLAALLRDFVDADGDGAAPSWLGGTDCAESDATRGPMQREIPGDDIDQDCSGADAALPLPALIQPPSPWPDCTLSASERSVVVFTVDALRSDRVIPELMPNVSRLVAASTVFRRAYVPTALTTTSTAALFAGRPLSDLGTQNPVADDSLTLDRHAASAFAAAGYRTAGFQYFAQEPRVAGAFSSFNGNQFDVHPAGIKFQLGSAAMINGVLEFIFQEPSKSFVWAHLPDAHAPYLTPHVLANAGLPGYDAALVYTDHHIGRALNMLRQTGRLASTIVVISADHGEELRQHGRVGHGPNLYEETVNVPLVVFIPGCSPRSFDHPVSTAWLMASLGELTGVAISGRRLGSQPSELPVVVEEAPTTGLAFKRAIYDGSFKLVVDQQNGGRALFDLSEDPAESTNLFGERDVSALWQLYQRWLDAPGER